MERCVASGLFKYELLDSEIMRYLIFFIFIENLKNIIFWVHLLASLNDAVGWRIGDGTGAATRDQSNMKATEAAPNPALAPITGEMLTSATGGLAVSAVICRAYQSAADRLLACIMI